jgi:hypothetical protein
LAVPSAAFAGPAEPEPSSDPEAMNRARDLHERAQTRYEMFDYLGAIDLWLEAYRILKADVTTREIRNAIVWNIATARIKAYEVDKDVRHLHQGLLLLRKYLKEFSDMYGTAPEAAEEQEKITKKVAELDELIRTSADEPTPGAPFPPGKGQPASGDGSTDKGPTDRAGKAKKIGPVGYAGIASLAVGAGLLGVMAYGLASAKTWQDRYDQFPEDRDRIAPEGKKANTAAIVGAVGTSVFLAGGIAMVVVDQVVLRKRREAKTALVPVFERAGGGLALRVSF